MEKKQIRKDANRVGAGLLIYGILMYLVVMVFMISEMIILLIQNVEMLEQDAEFDAFYDGYFAKMLESGTSSIVAVLVALAFLVLFFRKSIRFRELFQENQKMNVKILLGLVCIFLGAQLLFDVMAQGLELGLNGIGYSALESIESATSTSTTVSMFLYASIVGPIVEELVYRGFVLRSFQKYGKMFALIVSSVLFGVMHANLPQGIFAFGVGLILGYVALEYSIVWSIVLHIINNCVLGDLLGMALGGFSEQVQNGIFHAILIAGAIAAIIILCKKRKMLIQFVQNNRGDRKQYLYVITAVALALFVVINMGIAIAAITPMG